MPITVRPMQPADAERLVRTDFRAFGVGISEVPAGVTRLTEVFETDRFVVALDGADLVGNGGAFSFDLTVPGGATLPVSAITWIAVLPTHRRRGVMRSVMDALADDARSRGEAAMILVASEGSIYSNVGYGAATQWRQTELETRRIRFRPDLPAPAGRVRFVEPEDAVKVLGPIHDEVRLLTPGEISRTEDWWTGHVTEGPHRLSFFVVHTDDDGHDDGYAAYKITERWHHGHPGHLCEVEYFGAATPEAHAALWRYLCSLDLVSEVTTRCLAPDDPLPLLVENPRLVRTTEVNDGIWHRLLDTPAFLSARRYAVDDELVLDVTDDEPGVSGRWRVAGGRDAATCAATDLPADLSLSPRTLSAIAIGAAPVHQQARAGHITASDSAAIDRLARFLRWEPVPWCGTNF